MKVRYSRRSIDDLVAIGEFIAERSPGAAEQVVARLRSSIEMLELFPRFGRITDDPDIRMFPVVRYPYLVFYEVMNDEVVIHHIRHGAREPFDVGELKP